ncbi:MAG TPA: SpoIIE family protein phosphatase, partial [Turneriella sp.]|nr:SpoIIE family protein phosphatase [Turneriella sp.]
RARLISEAELQENSMLKKFAVEDTKFAESLKAIAEKKNARLEELRKKGTPPFKDKDFMALANEYEKMVDKRDATLKSLLKYHEREKEHFAYAAQLIKEKDTAIKASLKKIQEYQKLLAQIAAKKAPQDAPSLEETESALEIERQDLEAERAELAALKESASSIENNESKNKKEREKTNDLLIAEALLNLRDAALYGRIRLSLVSEQELLKLQRRNAKPRQEQLDNFAAIRRFIYTAKNETDIPVARGRKSPLAGGVLAITRSEAEEQMHDLDSRPLLGEKGLVHALLNENIAGYNMIVIDKTFGLERIWKSTQRLLIFSSVIGFLAVLAAWFFSGMAVRRIQSLSKTSGEVKEGKLDVEFNDKGYDELSTLGQSLNAMVHGLKEREELRGELMAAEEIQKRLLPATVPLNLKARADIAGFYKAMVGIGGDYFDYVALGNDHIAIAMGDVSSHGVGPALVMAMTRSQLHAELREKEVSLSKILLKLNEQLYLETPSHMFVTFFLGLYNLKTGELQYISAGHSKPLFYSAASKKTTYLEAGGMPLGMDDNDFFESTMELRKVNLKHGDIFLQYTDGLSEAMSATREQFGYERMEKALSEHTEKSPDGILQALAQSVEKFANTKLTEPGPSSLSDDIALVCLKRA